MREKKQQQQIPFHKKCPKVSWPTNGRASFRTPFLLLTIRSAQAQRLQPLTPEMCVKLHDFVANKHHLMQEEYGSPAWRIQGRGPGGRAQTEARRAENLFLRPDPHPSRSVWPASSPSYLKVWIRYWNKMIFITRLTKVSVSIEVLHFSTLSLGMLISHGGIP